MLEDGTLADDAVEDFMLLPVVLRRRLCQLTHSIFIQPTIAIRCRYLLVVTRKLHLLLPRHARSRRRRLSLAAESLHLLDLIKISVYLRGFGSTVQFLLMHINRRAYFCHRAWTGALTHRLSLKRRLVRFGHLLVLLSLDDFDGDCCGLSVGNSGPCQPIEVHNFAKAWFVSIFGETELGQGLPGGWAYRFLRKFVFQTTRLALLLQVAFFVGVLQLRAESR